MTSFGKRTIPAEPAASALPPGRVVVPGSTPIAGSAVKSADLIRDQVLLRIEPVAAVRMNKPELTLFVNRLVAEIANERKLLLNQTEQDALTRDIVDEMIGLGLIEPLLHDSTVSDILVNGPHMIYMRPKRPDFARKSQSNKWFRRCCRVSQIGKVSTG